MKRLLLLLCLAPMLCPGARFDDNLVSMARDMGWTDADVARLGELCASNRAAIAARRTAKGETAPAPKVDPLIEALKRDAKARANRYEILRRTQTAHLPGRTNLVARIMRQSLGERLAEARAGWTNALQRAQANWAMYTNQATRVSALVDMLNAKRAEYVEKRDKATLPTTRALYQAFIDQIDQWLAKLEPKKEDE